jgi:hypothetical protein
MPRSIIWLSVQNRLPGNAQVAGYVGRAHDPADDIGHDHRLRAIDVWPAAFVKARLKTFIEPAEALEQGDDKLVREHGECWKSRKFAALAAAAAWTNSATPQLPCRQGLARCLQTSRQATVLLHVAHAA